MHKKVMQAEHLMHASSFMRAETIISSIMVHITVNYYTFSVKKALFSHIMHLFEIIMLLTQLVQVYESL